MAENGIADGISSIIRTADKIIKLCSKYIRQEIRNAKKDIGDLRGELRVLRNFVNGILDLLDNPDDESLQVTRESINQVNECAVTLFLLERGIYPDLISRFLYRLGLGSWKWPFSHRQVEQSIQNIRQMRTQIAAALQVDQFRLLNKIGGTVTRINHTVIATDQRKIIDSLPRAAGASYDSLEEQHKSRCLRNTRVDLLREMNEWVHNNRARTIFWLNGMAGTGKSTIARTFAASSASRDYLGASFFFKRGEADRGSITKFYTTVAHQLAGSRSAITPHIVEALRKNPGLVDKTVAGQFNSLVLHPIQQAQETTRSRIVIVIDALDECTGDEDIRQLIKLFSSFGDHRDLRVRVLITSRPELPLRLGFERIRGKHQDLVLHKIPETILVHDLNEFFKYKLEEIRNDYNYSVSESRQLRSDWPGSRKTATLVQMAVPLFIFADTVCRFLSDRRQGNPDRQLRRVLAYENGHSAMAATYLPPLEQQLSGLSPTQEKDVIDEFRNIVGTIVILETPLSAKSLSELLDIPRDQIDARLDMLHSVLNVPQSSNSPIRLLHLSFRDFLLDPGRRPSNPFWVIEKEAQKQVAAGCLRVMKRLLRENICALLNPGIHVSDIPSTRIDTCVSAELRYSCLYWVKHLRGAQQASAQQDEEVFELLSRHLLHWLEVLSLIGKSAEGLHSIHLLQELTQDSDNDELTELLREANYFLRSNLSIIGLNPLQLYSSLVAFTPESSLIYSLFRSQAPRWMCLAPKPEPKWDQCQQVIRSNKAVASIVTLSADSLLLASASRKSMTVRIWRVDTGTIVRELRHNAFIKGVKFAPDSSLIASFSEDGSLILWKGDNYQCVHRLQTQAIFDQNGFGFSPDSQHFSFISKHDALVIMRLGQHDDSPPLYVKTSPHTFQRGQRISSSNRENRGSRNSSKTRRFPICASVLFSPDSRTVAAVSSWSGDYSIWSSFTGQLVQKEHRHHPSLFTSNQAIGFSGSSSLVVAGVPRIDGTMIHIRKMETGQTIQKLKWDTQNVDRILISPDGKLLVATSEAGRIRTWNINTGQRILAIYGHSARVENICLSQDMGTIASTSRDRTIRVWRAAAESGTLQQKRSHHGETPRLVLSSDRSLVASSTPRDFGVWNMMTGNCLKRFADCRPSGSFIFSASSEFILESSPNAFSVWNIASGERIHHFRLTDKLNFFLSPNGKYVVRLFSSKTIHILEPETLLAKKTLKGEGYTSNIVFSANDRFMAAIFRGPDRRAISRVYIWDLETGNRTQRFTTQYANTEVMAISPDAKLLAVRVPTRSGQLVQILHTDTGMASFEADVDEMAPDSIKFDSQSRYLTWIERDLALILKSAMAPAQTSGDGRVYVWDVTAPEQIKQISLDTLPSHFNVDAESGHLVTNMGIFSIKNTDSRVRDGVVASCVENRIGYGLSGDLSWVTWNSIKFFWIPPQFRPHNAAAVEVSGSTIAIGSGRVLIMKFDIATLLSAAYSE